MAPKSKIVDESEVVHWFEEGRTYRWMVEEYERKYNVQIAPTTFSNFRSRRGLPRRMARDADLIPWEVKVEHRFSQALWALRTEARLRSGLHVREESMDRLNSWKNRQFADGLVIHYDPQTEQGWWLVPRREGVDLDLIREPDRPSTKRRARD